MTIVPMAMAISSACMSFQGSAHEACMKSFEAGSKQSGLEQNVNKAQQIIEKTVDKKAHYYLGDTTLLVVGQAMFISKTVSDKYVKFDMPTMGICDRITNQVGLGNYSTLLEWRF